MGSYTEEDEEEKDDTNREIAYEPIFARTIGGEYDAFY